MFHATMRGAIDDARTLAQLDVLSRQVWRAHAAEAVTDADAQGLAETLHARRAALRETVAPVGIPLGRVTLFPVRRLQRSPERSEAIARRRRLACSGPMPPALACRFTTGQLAVLKIVGDAVASAGDCRLCLDAIAARAGVCRRLAQAAIRLAEGDGLLTVQERRRQGSKSDPNVVRILSREWLAWLRRGRHIGHRVGCKTVPPAVSAGIGCKPMRPTDRGFTPEITRAAEPWSGCRGAAGDPTGDAFPRIGAGGRRGRAMP